MARTTPAGPQDACAPLHFKKTTLARVYNALSLNKSCSSMLWIPCVIAAFFIVFSSIGTHLNEYPIIIAALIGIAVLCLSIVALKHRHIWREAAPFRSTRHDKVRSYQTNDSDFKKAGRLLPNKWHQQHAPSGIHIQDTTTRRQGHTEVDPVDRTQLLARMSHELRTPLNAVIGFTDLMQKELFGPLGSPRYQEYVQHIKDCGSALLKSTEDTIAMTSALTEQGGGSMTIRPVSLLNAAQEAWHAVDPVRKPKNAKLKQAIEPSLQVLMDHATLRQILLNLFSEALVHLGPSQIVSITASVDQELVQLEVSAKEPALNKSHNRVSHVENSETSLSLCLVRTLLELQGLSLFLISESNGAWRALTILDRAVQKDFFERPNAPTQDVPLATSQF